MAGNSRCRWRSTVQSPPLPPQESFVCQSCAVPELLFKVVFWLGYCNSLCNPVIYACWNREFKRAFGRILACRLDRRGRRRPDRHKAASDSCQSNNCHTIRVSGCGFDAIEMECAGGDASYFPKCSRCPSSRPHSPLIGLRRSARVT